MCKIHNIHWFSFLHNYSDKNFSIRVFEFVSFICSYVLRFKMTLVQRYPYCLKSTTQVSHVQTVLYRHRYCHGCKWYCIIFKRTGATSEIFSNKIILRLIEHNIALRRGCLKQIHVSVFERLNFLRNNLILLNAYVTFEWSFR